MQRNKIKYTQGFKIAVMVICVAVTAITGLPGPRWLLKIGAVFIKTETELILKSRWVIPERLLMAGFHFKYPALDSALEAIINDQALITNQ
jgi:NAD dependent epimerase/dehydratase family enzyme